MKMRTFIISMLLVSTIIFVFAGFYSNMATTHSVTFDAQTNQSLQIYNQFEELKTTTTEINDTIFTTSTGESSTVDLLGKFLGGGFNVLKVTGQSVTAFFTLTNGMSKNLQISRQIITIFLSIVVVIIFFLIVSVLVGKDI